MSVTSIIMMSIFTVQSATNTVTYLPPSHTSANTQPPITNGNLLHVYDMRASLTDKWMSNMR